MSKHTPGPWYQVGAWVEVEDDKRPDICTCNPEAMGQDHLKWSWETVYANARLIAAAPDLLDQLQDVLDRIQKSEFWWMDSPDSGGFDADAIRTAIAKATGRQKCAS